MEDMRSLFNTDKEAYYRAKIEFGDSARNALPFIEEYVNKENKRIFAELLNAKTDENILSCQRTLVFLNSFLETVHIYADFEKTVASD